MPKGIDSGITCTSAAEFLQTYCALFIAEGDARSTSGLSSSRDATEFSREEIDSRRARGLVALSTSCGVMLRPCPRLGCTDDVRCASLSQAIFSVGSMEYPERAPQYSRGILREHGVSVHHLHEFIHASERSKTFDVGKCSRYLLNRTMRCSLRQAGAQIAAQALKTFTATEHSCICALQDARQKSVSCRDYQDEPVSDVLPLLDLVARLLQLYSCAIAILLFAVSLHLLLPLLLETGVALVHAWQTPDQVGYDVAGSVSMALRARAAHRFSVPLSPV